jgi:succinoglycan biosynthesis protein ExoA
VLSLAAAPLFWPLAIPALVWATVALGYGLALAARSRDVAVTLAGPAAMIMHLAWSAGFWLQLGRAAGAGRSSPTRSALARSAA